MGRLKLFNFNLNSVCFIAFTSLVFLSNSIIDVASYNLSPKPNLIIRDPHLKTFLPKVQSTYFGFTLNLRQNGIFVGAPRAQSTLEKQKTLNETGAIYRCRLTDAHCEPYVFTDQDNTNVEDEEYAFQSERRENQWLGAAMDGGTHDSDKLLVCAPRLRVYISDPEDYAMSGVCYWVNDTMGDTAVNVKQISPLRGRKEQTREVNDRVIYYYQLAALGFSASVSPDNSEFIIGAPNVFDSRGGVIQYRQEKDTSAPNASRRRRELPRERKYISNVLIPSNRNDDSYFGYAVASGYFNDSGKMKLLYLATAPHGNHSKGEAYLFEVEKSKNDTKKYEIVLPYKYTFRGEKLSEYFGYSILVEDLNNDNLLDVIISAPFYGVSDFSDDGAVYVFMQTENIGFEKKLYKSPISGNGRFGTTLSKLGDINHDGYNDIAIGAPFDGDGSVFIYLGSKDGLREHHSQRLMAPFGSRKGSTSQYGVHMFGHGLSRGVDIDGNGFNDFAVGAPNNETVYLYRAYPVVKVIATIQSDTRQITLDQKTLMTKVCYAISTTSTQVSNQPLELHVVMDPQIKRVNILEVQSNEMSFNVTAGRQSQCRQLACEVRSNTSDIFKPVELEVHYRILKGIPDSEEFCDTCIAVDPAEPKVYTEKISFITGCATDVCVADLKVTSLNPKKDYTLGSSRTLSMSYEIENIGEVAYLPQIKISSSNRMPFARIPSNCKSVQNEELLCDLNHGRPMTTGSKDAISIMYDVSGVSGTQMTLKAEAISTGKEANPTNNIVRDFIELREYSQIDVTGKPKTDYISLEKAGNNATVEYDYEIKNNGPSEVGHMEITLSIPIGYRFTDSRAIIQIIDPSSLRMTVKSDGQILPVDMYQDGVKLSDVLLSKSTSKRVDTKTTYASSITKIIPGDNGAHYNPYENGDAHGSMHTEHVEQHTGIVDSVMVRSRSRRAIAVDDTPTKDHYTRIVHPKANDLLSEDMKDLVPVNRTIVFSCNDTNNVICVRAIIKVYNFKYDQSVKIESLRYVIDLNEVNQLLVGNWDFFVELIDLDVKKVATPVHYVAFAVNEKIQYHFISKYKLQTTPIWVIIVAVIGGILLLALVTYGLYRAGFFKRTKREEMAQLTKADGGPELENLNSGDN